MQEQVGMVTLDYTYYPGTDIYSDGAVEDEILDIVKTYPEEDYNRIIAKRKNWAVLYHLSHIRTNILEWYPFTGKENVLEIGAGCGAVTGVIADRAAHVTCVDLSKKRSLINANRNKNRKNIQIQIGNFADIEKNLTEKYDLITLIGVFEYADGYIGTDKPYEEFLRTIASHLKKDGKIIMAIENRLGLKYWAGCTEDHVGMYFEGLEGYPNTRGVKTFSKPELEQVMQSAGVKKYEFYYPYPDYKLPMSIYSDSYLPAMGDLRNNMVNFDRQRLYLFDEARAFDTIIESRLFPIYANSFLVILEGMHKNE